MEEDVHFIYNLNTGDIYRDLCHKWQSYPRYLFNEMETRLYYILLKYNKVTFRWNGDESYFESKSKQIEKFKEKSLNAKNEPFTRFFLHSRKGGEEEDLINYGENCIITYDNDKDDFNLFFALKLLVTDEMEILNFLNYQRKINFKGKDFRTFLELVLIKYSDFLKNGKIEIILKKYLDEIFAVEEDMDTIVKLNSSNKRKMTFRNEHPQSDQRVFDKEPETWEELQNFVGQLFIECGFETEISKIKKTARGQKEIDVYAKDISGEFNPVILIECKHWNKAVNQEVIHAFRTVVDDFGADSGFIVSKSGFQEGCYETVKHTNIRLVSLRELEQKYHSRWTQAMVNKYMPYADDLFSYWDYASGKLPQNKKVFSFENQRLLNSAYNPLCGLGPQDEKSGFKRTYPIEVPTLDNELKIIGNKRILTDRQFFDFIEDNKEKAIRHFKILFGEI